MTQIPMPRSASSPTTAPRTHLRDATPFFSGLDFPHPTRGEAAAFCHSELPLELLLRQIRLLLLSGQSLFSTTDHPCPSVVRHPAWPGHHFLRLESSSDRVIESLLFCAASASFKSYVAVPFSILVPTMSPSRAYLVRAKDCTGSSRSHVPPTETFLESTSLSDLLPPLGTLAW